MGLHLATRDRGTRDPGPTRAGPGTPISSHEPRPVLVVNISPAHLFAVEQRVLAVGQNRGYSQILRVETLREVFGTDTNYVVGFLH